MKLLLFSGGVDSTALAYWTRPDILLTIDYGQLPATGEIQAATLIAQRLELRHEVIRFDARELGRGQLAGTAAPVRDHPPEWWPYRNQLLVTLAAMRFEREGIQEIMLGTVITDAVHCDGRPEFLEALNKTMVLQAPHIGVTAPAIRLSSEELVAQSDVPQEILGWAFSCHTASVACGHCRGCNKTVELFAKQRRI